MTHLSKSVLPYSAQQEPPWESLWTNDNCLADMSQLWVSATFWLHLLSESLHSPNWTCFYSHESLSDSTLHAIYLPAVSLSILTSYCSRASFKAMINTEWVVKLALIPSAWSYLKLTSRHGIVIWGSNCWAGASGCLKDTTWSLFAADSGFAGRRFKKRVEILSGNQWFLSPFLHAQRTF